jgi:hypothetical protein
MSGPSPFSPMKEPTGTHLTGSRVGPRPDLEILEDRKRSGSCLEASHEYSIINPVADIVYRLCYPVPKERKNKKVEKKNKRKKWKRYG